MSEHDDLLDRLARRVADPTYDPRHAVLDVSGELLAIDPETIPPRLRDEFRDLTAEVQTVLPDYPSRREMSPLFDRAGLGRPGRDRAERLVRRLVALAASVRRTASE